MSSDPLKQKASLARPSAAADALKQKASLARPLAAAVGLMLLLVGLRPRHATPPALALTALANASASIERDAAKYVSALLEEISDQLSGQTVDCAIDFAFCGRSSCTRHANTSVGGVEVAACACEPVERSSTLYAEISWNDGALVELLAQSPAFVTLATKALYGSASAATLSAELCAAVADGGFYPELGPDRLSFPSPTWKDAHPSEIVANTTCDGELATAVCSGAPCFDDPSSPGPLNVTCLCPVYPLGGSDHTFGLTAPDVGHMGGCAAYARDGGECARQSTLDALVGEVERAWVVAAVDAMASAGRWTGTSRCRAWYS